MASTARQARCWKCQSFGTPSVAEYWHIGETMMRLRAVTDLKVIGRNRCGLGSRWSILRPISA